MCWKRQQLEDIYSKELGWYLCLYMCYIIPLLLSIEMWLNRVRAEIESVWVWVCASTSLHEFVMFLLCANGMRSSGVKQSCCITQHNNLSIIIIDAMFADCACVCACLLWMVLVGLQGWGAQGEFCPHQRETHISSDGSRASPVPVRNTSQLSESGVNRAYTSANTHTLKCTYTHIKPDNIRIYIKGCYSLSFFFFIQL